MVDPSALEGVAVMLFGGQYRDREVFLTGHTGFKGSWLALWLHALGARVTGVALAPDTNPSHWTLLGLDVVDRRIDVRDADSVLAAMRTAKPEIVLHLAAQPLVRRSYRAPVDTWSTNVVGTAAVLDACRQTSSVKAVIVVTTDKCYQNQEWPWSYRETDPLGGHDPYSASKAAAELVASSYRDAFFQDEGAPLVATARAGNVIGGGDWSEDRLIPDLVRGIAGGAPAAIRSPNATRPWQHVLDSLSGYLRLGELLLSGDRRCADAWNFGPDGEGGRRVADVLCALKVEWPALDWSTTSSPQPRETTLLGLDATKARTQLGWRPVWPLDVALRETVCWYRHYVERGAVTSREQLDRYVTAAVAAGASWVTQ